MTERLSAPSAGARRRPERGRLLFALLLLPLLAACGRKGDPVAPERRLPSAVSRVRITGPEGRLTVSWDAPRRDLGGKPLEPLVGYRIWRSAWPAAGEGCPACPPEVERVAEVDAEQRRAAGRAETHWVDEEAVPGWLYVYQVQAVAVRGRVGPPSPPVQIVWVRLPPPRFTLESQDGSAQARFEDPVWPDPATPVGYRIYDVQGNLLAQETHPSTLVQIPTLENDVEVVLEGRLAARTPEGWVVESPGTRHTVVPRDRVPPLPPSSVVTFVRPGAVQLNWLLPAGEPYARIVVLRGPSDGPLQELAELPGHAATYLDRDVEPGMRYDYALVGVDAAGNRSLQTRPVTARPLDGEEKP